MDEFLFRLRQFSGWLIGLVGLLAAYFSAWDIFGHFIKDQTTLSWMANGYLIFLFFIFFFVFVARQFQTMRKERYANISTLLHQCAHYSRDLQSFLDEKKPEGEASRQEYEFYLSNAKIKVIQILDLISGIFRELTATHCRSCIKLVYPDNGQLYFYTFARDGISSARCRQIDNNRVEQNHDPLTEEKNKKFTELFQPNLQKWFYFCNNLARDHEFKTTSTTAYNPNHAEDLQSHGKLGGLLRKWPLPYRSTMAVVIRQGPFDFFEGRRSEVLGFLAVDSESRGVFVERWDIQILFVAADALFLPLKKIITAQREAEAAGFEIQL